MPACRPGRELHLRLRVQCSRRKGELKPTDTARPSLEAPEGHENGIGAGSEETGVPEVKLAQLVVHIAFADHPRRAGSRAPEAKVGKIAPGITIEI